MCITRGISNNSKLSGIILVLIILFHLNRLINNFSVGDDDIWHFDLAKNIVETGICKIGYRPFNYENIISLSYPPLHPFLNAISLKIFGINYHSIFIPSFILYIASCLLFLLLSNKYLPTNMALISTILFLTDPLFFSFGLLGRQESTAIFLYLLTGVFFYMAHIRAKYLLWIAMGIFSGLLFMTTYNGIWIPISVFLYLIITKFKRAKEILTYYFFSGLIVFPYLCWIYLDEQRSKIFWFQISRSSSYNLYWLKKLLNPIADFYLIFFRHYSIYPFLFLISVIVLWKYRGKYLPLILLLIVPCIMMIGNMRAAHYLLITIGVCYLSFGFALQELMSNKRWESLFMRNRKIIYTIVSIIFILNMSFNTLLTFRKPDFIPDMVYYRKVLTENTEKSSRIVGDAGLFLAMSEGRKFFTVVPLIWDRWRLMYKYDEIFNILNPDYIVLTDRIKTWVELKHPQGKAFQDLLKQKFSLIKEIHDIKHGGLWIYKRFR